MLRRKITTRPPQTPAGQEEDMVFEMAEGRWLRLADQRAHRIECLAGSLGVTRNDDARAVVLGAEDRYQCDGRTVVMLHALQDSRVRLVNGPPAGSAGRVSALGALLARWRR